MYYESIFMYFDRMWMLLAEKGASTVFICCEQILRYWGSLAIGRTILIFPCQAYLLPLDYFNLKHLHGNVAKQVSMWFSS
uniref:Uncharacterized protein n=1 Tax=Arundo donax TaxID=35708 RepID=A0A0A9I3F1_ARUDO